MTWAQSHVPLRYRPPGEEKSFLESKSKENQFPKPERLGTMKLGTAWPHICGPGCTAALTDLSRPEFTFTGRQDQFQEKP